ncbi:MAG: HEAT repeat domain-containing protein [Planctomycetes bacterium]|nr:HEAT repeat domain-containing protein [Planctomycetota bacterium]
MRMTKVGAIATLALFLCSSGLFADVKRRWRLDFECEKPDLITYEGEGGDREDFWFVVYKVTNPTDQDVPLIIDLTLRTDKDRYSHNGYFPGPEEQIVAKLEHLVGLSAGLRHERLKEMKAAGRHLNTSDQRAKKFLKPKESFQGIAVFANVDRDLRTIDLLVAGLMDPVKYRTGKPKDEEDAKRKYAYENQILKFSYKRANERYYVQFDPIQFVRKDWIVKVLGTVGDLDTVRILIEALENNDPTIRKAAIGLLSNMLKQTYNFDGDKSVEENMGAILSWKEWWSRNQHKLVFNAEKGIFEVVEPPAK